MPNYQWSSESRFMFYKLKGIFKKHGFECESWVSVSDKKKTYHIQSTLTEEEIKQVEQDL